MLFCELNSNISDKIQYREITVNITNQRESFYTLDSAKDVSSSFPTADKIIAIGGRKQTIRVFMHSYNRK